MLYAKEHIRPSDWDWKYVIAIQPKITKFTNDGEDDNWSEYFENKLVGVDAHGGNFGYYKGEVKLFDW